MRIITETTRKKPPGTSKKSSTAAIESTLHHRAFDNSLQASIISRSGSGKIITANSAACKLLGYSKKELLTKSRTDIFDINESSFKKMLKQRTAEGHSIALVTTIRKSGKPLPCEITSAVFMAGDGVEKAITTIRDRSQSILKQKNIDTQKEKKVSDNIDLAKSVQKEIDIKKEKIVADDIVLAKSEQKEIDTKKEKIVADNIVLAKSKQKEIDTQKEKIVADNIAMAKSDQKEIDIKKEKIVADNIVLAKSEQKEIDHRKEKIVSDNIALAKTLQREIDAKKEKIVADNIVLAKSEQKKIDIKKEKIVADNIVLAKSDQKEIDAKRKKVVSDNRALAKSKQKVIDKKNKKIVAKNIVLAKSKQIEIDFKKEKTVSDNIRLAQAKSDSRLAENEEWIRYIAQNSYDVMWDWDIVSGQVYIGDSVEEVFGYKFQNNTINYTDLIELFRPFGENIDRASLTKALASSKIRWNDSYKIKRFDGSLASVVSRASIIRDDAGNAIRLIGATNDVSRQEELEWKLDDQINMKEEQKEKFYLAAKISFDIIWDWNLMTNELYMGEGFEELFGYTMRNNKGHITDWGNHVHPDDKEAVDQGLLDAIASSATHWEHAYRFIRADGTIARVSDRASIIRNADGKAYRMIGAIQDISRQKELEEKLDLAITTKRKLLKEYRESFKLIFNSSSDVLFDCDLIANKVVISDAYEKEFGHKITANMTPAKDWIDHIHPDDKEAVIHDYHTTIASDATEWKYEYRFLRGDNSVANVLSSVIILRDSGGNAYRMIGSMHDISKQTVLEERLELEIKLKERQIAEAAQEAMDMERSVIGKELHDNVNQLLGVSKLYLDMAKRGGENSAMCLGRTSEYLLTAIEEIRKLTKGLTTDIIKNLGLSSAIDNLTHDTMEVNPVKISCALRSFKENRVNDKFKLNIFRMIQEQLNNILKHARATEVTISLSQSEKIISLTISDNGIGFDTDKKYNGIGIDNIKGRAASYNGTADFVSHPGQGCVLTATFPVTDVLLNKG